MGKTARLIESSRQLIETYLFLLETARGESDDPILEDAFCLGFLYASTITSTDPEPFSRAGWWATRRHTRSINAVLRQCFRSSPATVSRMIELQSTEHEDFLRGMSLAGLCLGFRVGLESTNEHPLVEAALKDGVLKHGDNLPVRLRNLSELVTAVLINRYSDNEDLAGRALRYRALLSH